MAIPIMHSLIQEGSILTKYHSILLFKALNTRSIWEGAIVILTILQYKAFNTLSILLQYVCFTILPYKALNTLSFRRGHYFTS
jgi:hypothetical protein